MDARDVEAYVWDDQNGDGIQDYGEPSLGNITVNLLTAGNQFLASAQTNGLGIASISNVPADQNVKLEFELPNVDHAFTQRNEGADNTVDSDPDRTNGRTNVFILTMGAQTITHSDAGIWTPGTVEAFVWDDQNGNGVQDLGEPAIGEITVNLLTAETNS
ncbi:MAG: hypothetical protein IPH04_11795 [Saprospirales bacterium]|nr:hypothetical protein [Saprospirales bacterium]